ncbi:hypothetical protein QFC19_004186 [Naganishia cerealis]|uniref:Uncharacterized protein n=1 Tax=Naganishia cerealis TaxID=610337 RepID=A0ACC2VYU0_9TREE|nr:hypothetical protein QFC19_004186 [Naganishia cerealis]
MSLSASQLEDRQAREQFLNRPLPNELRHPDLTLEDLQEQATARQGLGDVEDELGGVTLRSLFWRIYLGTLNVNQVLSSTPRALLSNSLRDQRQQYDALRRKWLISPDGRWATDCTSPDVVDGSFDGSSTSEGTKQAESVVNGIAWDPLNLGETNPWQTWFAQTELRGTIDKDVERTFPDIPYFRDPYVRRVLKTVLFLWAMENSDITYRQGMHELLAVIMLVCDRDSLNRDTLPAKNSQSSYIGNDRYLNVPMSPLQSQLEDGRHSPSGEKMEDAMYMVLDRRFLEHDVHGLFVKLMEHAGSWYEWRTETIEGSLAQDRSKQKQVTKGRIIAMCQHMQGVLLKQVDPVLWQTLENAAIEPQIWGIRWIRVLFTREFPFASALRLWDGLFAIRDQMDDLVESAMKVLKDPTIATGAAIALENQEVLGIQPLKLDAPETPIPSNTSAFRSKRQPQAFGRGQFGPASSPAKGYGFESFTRGLMDRAQASGKLRKDGSLRYCANSHVLTQGIDKALLTTVSTLSEFRVSYFSYRT